MNINEYGRKPKAGVQVDYPKEIASRTGTNAKMVEKWLADNSFDPLTILQGIGSKRINLMDFVSALLSDKGNQQFIKKYADDRADGKWSSVWKGTPKNESNIQKVKRMIREAILKEDQTKWVSFGSHKSLDKAERILGQLPKGKGSFRHEGQFYPLTDSQIEQIKQLPMVKIKDKLPGNPDEWVNLR